ncbi:hypothetical protein JHK86_014541 [Glycine max]|nr:hypothetical protein JHK86_014541 [Glycine max]
MEQNACKELSKIASNFKCEKVLETVDESIVCPTPQKNEEPLTVKSKEGQTNLPEKYSTLADLFGHMSCSLRLLYLCKKAPIFKMFAARKFSHAHLAQMKYILPKSVYIDRVLVHDKKSLCVVPDMKITLKFEVVKDCFGESADLALRRYFKSKLIDFFDMHPEDMPTQKSTSSYKPAKRVLDFSLMEDNDGLGIEMDKLESIRALHESSRGCSEDCNSFGSVSAPQETFKVVPSPETRGKVVPSLETASGQDNG